MQEKRRSQIVTVTFLIFFILVIVIGLCIPQQTFSESENRFLQKKPKFTIENLMDGSYGKAYEDYLSDQFPQRERFVGLKVLAERVQGKRDVNGVYFGKEGYLIEKFDTEDMITKQLCKNENQLTDFISAAGDKLGKSRVKVMLVPSSSQVLTDKLPPFAAPFNQSNLISKLDENLIVSTEQTLKRHGSEEIYYRTDHHWSALGAYYAYETWAKSMGLIPWEKEKFEIKTISRDFYGTVYSKVNVPRKADTIELYMTGQESDYTVYYDGSDTGTTGLYSYEALNGRDQYAVYLDGNHGLTKIVNAKVSQEGKGMTLLIIKDSFAHSFAPFAANHYETTYLLDLRYYNGSVSEFMDKEAVTDLLFLYYIPGFAKDKNISKLR